MVRIQMKQTCLTAAPSSLPLSFEHERFRFLRDKTRKGILENWSSKMTLTPFTETFALKEYWNRKDGGVVEA